MFSFLIPLLDVVKLVIASVTSVVLLAFAGLTLAGSAVALVVSTPLFLIFSPILVPATIATTLLATGLTAGATLGVTAIGLIIGLIKTAEGTSLALAQKPSKMLKFSGEYSGSWGGKPYSGTFGNNSAGGLTWSWKWNGKSLSGTIPNWLQNQPWFKGLPPGGAAPAAGAAPAPAAAPAAAAGAAPAPAPAPAGGAAPASGSTPRGK